MRATKWSPTPLCRSKNSLRGLGEKPSFIAKGGARRQKNTKMKCWKISRPDLRTTRVQAECASVIEYPWMQSQWLPWSVLLYGCPYTNRHKPRRVTSDNWYTNPNPDPRPIQSINKQLTARSASLHAPFPLPAPRASSSMSRHGSRHAKSGLW